MKTTRPNPATGEKSRQALPFCPLNAAASKARATPPALASSSAFAMPDSASSSATRSASAPDLGRAARAKAMVSIDVTPETRIEAFSKSEVAN
jgi:hypothetical protein